MGEARSEITIAKPADEVWATVGAFGELGWNPTVDACELDGDDRTLTMFGGKVTVIERQLRRDDAARTLTYGIVGGVPVDHHESTITVTPQGEESLVTWDIVVDDAAVEMMKSGCDDAAGMLKRALEG